MITMSYDDILCIKLPEEGKISTSSTSGKKVRNLHNAYLGIAFSSIFTSGHFSVQRYVNERIFSLEGIFLYFSVPNSLKISKATRNHLRFPSNTK